MDSPQFGLDRSSQPSQVQGYPSVDSSVKAPVWPAQSYFVQDGQTTGKLEGATDTKSGMPGQFTLSKPVITLASSASPFQGTSSNTHADLSRMVQKFLQPQASECPLWTPPSRDYMNKATDCQTCKTVTTDVDDVYVCDACEKAYHLKCLQINPAKGVQRGEWHCDKCLQLINGKPLPPKYGHVVLRKTNAPKMPPSSSALQSTSDKKAGPLGEKVNYHKAIPNGGPVGSTGGHPTLESKVANSELKLPPSNTVRSKRPLAKSLQEYPNGKKLSKNVSEKSPQDDSGTVSIPAEISTVNSRPREERPQPDCLKSVEWIGGMLKIEDQKAYYQSCCINGLLYRVEDHALVHFSDRLIPSKLQAMWEDTINKTKWVTVNLCYFPSDLPVAVGHPYHLDNTEVYESTVSCIVMAGFIHGPCEVLSPSKYLEEYVNTGKKPSRPLFLCQWIYDESRRLFRDVNY